MKKHPYHTPEAELLRLKSEDLLVESGEGGEGGEGGGTTDPTPPFWQGGDIVFPDLPLG